jgi:hypothetical protein
LLAARSPRTTKVTTLDPPGLRARRFPELRAYSPVAEILDSPPPPG